MSPVEARLLEKVRTERDALRARDADSMAIIEVLRAECVAERAKCDALRARVAELEATLAKSLANRITEKAAQAALERQVAEAHERLDEFGIRRDGESATLVEGIAAMRERIDEYRAEWYRAEAQVAAARQFIEDDTCRHDEEKRAVFRAMDEAAKK